MMMADDDDDDDILMKTMDIGTDDNVDECIFFFVCEKSSFYFCIFANLVETHAHTQTLAKGIFGSNLNFQNASCVLDLQ